MSGVRKKRWKGPLPVSAIQGVLLKDNRFAGMLLEDRLKQLHVDRRRAKNLLDWQQQSFLLNQAIKETELREMGVYHTSFLPEVTMKTTEPDVRARRPFGKVRRSAAQMMEDLSSFEKRLSLPALTPKRSLSLPEFASSVPSDVGDASARSQNTRGSFTQLHGIELTLPRKSKTEVDLRRSRRQSFSGSKRLSGGSLPLYGPEAEADREEKEKRHVRSLQRKMREMKIDSDERFLRLEKSLVRDSPDDQTRTVRDRRPRDEDKRAADVGKAVSAREENLQQETEEASILDGEDQDDVSEGDGSDSDEEDPLKMSHSSKSDLSHDRTHRNSFFE